MLKIRRNNLLKRMIYIWVVMWCINFMGKGTRIALFGGLALFIPLVIKKRKIPWSFIFMTFQICAFGVIYTFMINYYEDLGILRGYRDMFIPIVLYYIGFLSINDRITYEDNLNYFRRLFAAAAFALFIYASANLFSHMLIYGQIIYYNRRMNDIWTGSLTAATTQGSRLILMSAMLPSAILSKHKYNSIYKIILFACIIMTVVETLIMANRTLLIILMINFLACLLLFIRLNRYKSKSIIERFLVIFFTILLLVIVYITDMFGVQSFFKESNFYLRMQAVNNNIIADNVRIDAWKVTLQGLLKYPMGGSKAPIALSAPHNLWLDVAYTAGIVPFILLIGLSIGYVYYYRQLVKSHKIDNEFKVFLTSISVSLLLNCMVEPILGGHYILFMIFIFQLGLMHGLDTYKIEIECKVY